MYVIARPGTNNKHFVQGVAMISVNGTQVASSQWTTISTMTIDTTINGEERITYFFESVTNDVLVQVQGSVNNINWIPLNTRDMNDVDVQEETILVSAGTSGVAVLSPGDRDGINCGFQLYRIQIMGNAPYGTLNAWAFAK